MRGITLRVAHYGLTASLLGSAAIAGLACIETTSPPSGVFRVVVSTTGATSDVDPDGYVLSMNDGYLRIVGVESVVRISYVQRGMHALRLDGLTENCAVVGDNPRSVVMPADVPFKANLRVDFSVQCVPSGELRVTTATTGVDIDDDGYQLVVEGTGSSTSIEVPANGTVTVPRLLPGNHAVRLDEIEPNCNAVTPNPHSVAIGVGSVATVALELKCVALPQLAFVDVVNNNEEIFVMDAKGRAVSRLTVNAASDRDPAWSPDGKRLAFASNRDGDFELYLMNADGTGEVRLTNSAGDDQMPTWSPDGTRIAFVSNRDGDLTIYVMDADGTGAARITSADGRDAYEPAWSPDGSRIAFTSSRAGTSAVLVMNPDGSGVVPLTFSLDDSQPAWSPDGSRIAFTRRGSDTRGGVFTMKADGSDVRRVTDVSQTATDPAWSAAGIIAFGVESCIGGFYYYYYDCFNEIASVNPDATPYAPAYLTRGRAAFGPAWRP